MKTWEKEKVALEHSSKLKRICMRKVTDHMVSMTVEGKKEEIKTFTPLIEGHFDLCRCDTGSN